MKRKTKSRINKLRWKEISEELRIEHPSCEVCKKVEHLQVHHIVSKFFHKSLLRFEKYNLIVVCSKCHFIFHKNPVSTMDWFIRNRKEDWNKILQAIGTI